MARYPRESPRVSHSPGA